ncbi:MAG: hypothetical protein HRT71_21535 [Flavobacteriales bacterium]|nr:hypothetical protein [Flavobacteriales bacterium]
MNLKKSLSFLTSAFLLVTAINVNAQSDTDAKKDTSRLELVNQDAIYNRPFIKMDKLRTAVGGYMEANTNYFAEDGVSEGFSMELRRFNIFLYSTIHERIKFLSELEFEHGTEEIALETALLDIEINSAFIFRAGILLPQIGLVNANHDSPKWDFVDRPLSSTTLIPSTLSEVGFGFHGKLYPSAVVVSYDAYVTNGLQASIVNNSEGRTFVPGGKNEEMFGEDNNGVPMFNAKVSVANRKVGEYGISYYGGAYNTFRVEGEVVDATRNVHIVAFDWTFKIKKIGIKGEYVMVKVDVPEELLDLYGTTQHGGFIEINQQVFDKKIMDFEHAKLLLNVRGEIIDYNVGDFSTPSNTLSTVDIDKGDNIASIMAGVSLRLTSDAVLKFNYRFQKTTDLFRNPAANLGGFQFGIATYF